MNDKISIFESVTLLITHFNRSSSLERLLRSFKQLNVSFYEIIVSDDSSKAIHLNHIEKIRKEFDFKLISSPVNKGLANNLNKGQNAVKSAFTLYVQEDFVPKGDFFESFKDALHLMESDKDIDLIRFHAYDVYPYLKPYKKGYSEMIYKPWFINKNKIYNYSDHPHLRRDTFFERFGRYTEGIKSDKAEYEMCLSFIQNNGRALFYDDFRGLFEQVNSDEEPSTVQRIAWRQSNNPVISFVRLIYRQFKYNFDLHVNPKFKRKNIN